MAGSVGLQEDWSDLSCGEFRQTQKDMVQLGVGDVVVSKSGTRRKVLEVLNASKMHYRFEVTRTNGSSFEQELSWEDIDETAVADIIKSLDNL